MAVSAAQLLDELMGRDRNRAPGEPSSKHHWSDPEVCKSFLCGFCPHELFTNTKADLGTCPKVHDEPLKKEYENSNRRGHMGYEENFMRFLQGTMADVERRIRRGHERLALNAKKEKELTNIKGDDEKISMISDHINQLLEEIESLGTQGKVEEAQGVMKLVDQLKEEKETLSQMSKLNPLSSQEKQMEVCEICGAFLIVGDAQSRVDDHLQGKQHVGYARIKNTLEEMQAGTWKLNQQDSKEESEKNVSIKSDDATEREGRRGKSREGSKETSRRRDRGDRDRADREKRGDRDRDRDRSRERNRDRDRDRDRRERERSRERRRDRGKRRSRSRERRSRSRDRYRKRGSRDRDRRRSRSHDRSRRRSRSRDRDRKRSRSGERDRRRSRSRERKSGRSRSRSRGHRRSRSRSQSQNHKVRSSRDSADSDQSFSKKDGNSCKEAEPVNSVAVSSTREGSEIKEEHEDVASLNNTADQDM